jgi:TusA-related sulfurtransferase
LRRAQDCRGCGTQKSRRGADSGLLDLPGSVEAPLLDLSGFVCPATYLETRKVLERLPARSRLWVQLTSDEAARNVPRSAVAAGHRVLARLSDGRTHRVLLERGSTDELSDNTM